MRNFGLLICLVMVLASSLAGCGKDAADSGTFTAVYSNTISKACVSCHSPGGSAPVDKQVALDFSSQASAFQTLTSNNVTSITSRGICPGVKIITAGNASNSYFAAVLFSDYSRNNFVVNGCTPFNGHHQDQSLSGDEKKSIIDWINNGAQNN